MRRTGRGIGALCQWTRFRHNEFESVFGASNPVSKFHFGRSATQFFRAHATVANSLLSRTRNIGVIAHVDAGKTTTCERMLYYAGVTNRIGDVDKGTTVLDYMPLEQERGITINAAAISFDWLQHRINLIDTPGHVDFMFEVERSIRVLDGAVAIFDAVAGVQAQTETVWSQARRYSVPVIAYLNKMDRDGASFENTVEMIAAKLSTVPIPVQMPYFERGQFDGVIDLLSMELLRWEDQAGVQLFRTPLGESGLPSQLISKAEKMREEMIELLADRDEQVMEAWVNSSSSVPSVNIPQQVLRAGLRRIVLASQGVPVLCGASFRNKGVQPLLDAVAHYLPSPLERPPVEALDQAGKTTYIQPSDNVAGLPCALAFKVVHNHQRGPLVYFRVYSGKITSGMTVHNTTLDKKERISKILSINGEDMEDIPEITVGNIGAAVGLKETRTGDTLIAHDKKSAALRLKGMKIPPPVFVCSVEPSSPSAQKALDQALSYLQREDPSFTLTVDEETGQTLMAGMGELHLEILQHRLQTHYKVPMDVGKIRISYRATITASASGTVTRAYEIAGRTQSVELSLTLAPASRGTGTNVVDTLGDTVASPVRQALHSGLTAAFARGIFLGYPLDDIKATVTRLSASIDVTESAVMACAVEALREIAQSAKPTLLEPQMRVSYQLPHGNVGDVVSDISGVRRGYIEKVEMGATLTHILAEVPLKELVGYSTIFRSLTRGAGSYSMEFSRYKDMSTAEYNRVLDGMYGRSSARTTQPESDS